METTEDNLKDVSAERLLHDFAPRIYSLARRLLDNDADAEDVTQDVLLQVLRKRDTFRGESAFSTWLYRLTVNAALAYRRQRGNREKHRAQGDVEDLPEAGTPGGPVQRWSAPPDEIALDHETRQLIEKAIAGLDEKYRDVYVLADVEGLSNAEVGSLLGLGLPAVKSRLHRARLMMRAALAPHFEEKTQ
jgi:RNA polymerase sigma-70 factor (ECF subfamily)